MTMGKATFHDPEARQPILFGTTGEAPLPKVSYHFDYPRTRFRDIFLSLGRFDHVVHLWRRGGTL